MTYDRKKANVKSKWHPYDSSKTRICPAFRVISENPIPFWTLLKETFGLPICPAKVRVESKMFYADEMTGNKEMSLSPNPEYLKWLLRHPEKTRIGDVLSKKKNLNATDRERLELLKKGSNLDYGLKGIATCFQNQVFGKKWYILEGATRPDVYIKTNQFYLIVEGKRTECGPERGTTWDANRHQIVRHIEGLRFRREAEALSLPFYGMFIAREKDRSKFDIYRDPGPFKESLPHIVGKNGSILDQRYFDEIRKSYLGMISWGTLYKVYQGKIKYFSHVLEDGTLEPYGEYDQDE